MATLAYRAAIARVMAPGRDFSSTTLDSRATPPRAMTPQAGRDEGGALYLKNQLIWRHND